MAKPYSSQINTATKKRRTEQWSDAISASKLVKRLKDHSDGKVEMSPTQIKAIEIILARLVPTLSAVEQTVVNETDKLTEDQLNDKLLALFASRPDLLDTALALRNAAREPDKPANAAVQTGAKA